MKFLLVSTFLFISLVGKAQSTTIRVLGEYRYVVHSETNGVIITVDDKNLNKKKNLLSNKMDSLGIKSGLTKMDPENLGDKRLHFKIEEADRDLFDQLLIIINDLQVNIHKVYFKIPPHEYKDEYHSAKMALKNANSQAKIIASNLDFKIIEILNIDDETTYASPIYDNIDFDSKKGKLMIKLLDLLFSNESSLYEEKSSKPSRHGGYSIWVTYLVRPN